MSKELIVSANRHETRVAVLEDDQVVEVYYQREKEYSLAGSIHKGRVTRVLPGMQSAFVDIGLDRDAFLYVSDFFEDNDEYDKIVTSVEEKVLKMEKGPAPGGAPPAVDAALPAELPAPEPTAEAPPAVAAAVAAPAPAPLVAPAEFARRNDDRDRRGGRRGRRRRPKGRGLPESKYFSPGQHSAAGPAAACARRGRGSRAGNAGSGDDAPEDIVVLPGESLAKYRGEAMGQRVPAWILRKPEATAPETGVESSRAVGSRSSRRSLADDTPNRRRSRCSPSAKPRKRRTGGKPRSRWKPSRPWMPSPPAPTPVETAESPESPASAESR